jgi:hypothetical protein
VDRTSSTVITLVSVFITVTFFICLLLFVVFREPELSSTFATVMIAAFLRKDVLGKKTQVERAFFARKKSRSNAVQKAKCPTPFPPQLAKRAPATSQRLNVDGSSP